MKLVCAVVMASVVLIKWAAKGAYSKVSNPEDIYELISPLRID